VQFLYCFLQKTQAVRVCAQSEHTRLRLLAETFGNALRTVDPALTFSGDFYIPAPMLCSLSLDKYNVFLFYFSLTLDLSFKNCPLFCVLILQCIVDAGLIFLQFRQYIFQDARKKIFSNQRYFFKRIHFCLTQRLTKLFLSFGNSQDEGCASSFPWQNDVVNSLRVMMRLKIHPVHNYQ